MRKMGEIMKNSKGDIEFEIIDDGLSTATWNVSATGTDKVAENVDNQKKMVITGHSTNTAVDEENVIVDGALNVYDGRDIAEKRLNRSVWPTLSLRMRRD